MQSIKVTTLLTATLFLLVMTGCSDEPKQEVPTIQHQIDKAHAAADAASQAAARTDRLSAAADGGEDEEDEE